MTYDVDYFIEKFSKIPENRWCKYLFKDGYGKMCALGFCGETEIKQTQESLKLRELFFINLNNHVGETNNSPNKLFPQKTPKGRILAALRMIKKMEKR